MNRRNFLKSIIALSAAPAIVKADNIMKIWVPSERVLTFAELHALDVEKSILFGMDRGDIDATIISRFDKINSLLDDMPFIKGREMTIRTGMPPMGWAAINNGI